MREAGQSCMRRLVGPIILLSLQGRNDRSDTSGSFISSHRIGQFDIPIPAALSLAGWGDLVIILHEVTALHNLYFPV